MCYLHLPDRERERKRQRHRERKRNRHRERARVRSAPIRSPDDSKVKQKMLFASSKDALRRSLVGIAAEIQGTDFSEVAHESGTSPRAFDVLRSVLNGAPSVCVSAVPVLPCSDRQCSTRSREEVTERRTRPSRLSLPTRLPTPDSDSP